MAVDEAESSAAAQQEEQQKLQEQQDAAAAAAEVCPDCKKKHGPRRLIVVHDAKGMLPEEATEDPRGNTTNMLRIWSMVKEGMVQDPTSERQVEQVLVPFIEGIQQVENVVERFFPSLVGDGVSAYEMSVKDVYKRCCAMCPSRDEIFMFGFSRGAYILRSVVGFLHHLQALRPDTPEFELNFVRAFRIYREAPDETTLKENKLFQEISQKTRRPAKIRYLACMDTVKAVDDQYSLLHDIGDLETVQHVRHAMALFERREMTKIVRFQVENEERRYSTNRSFQEAWFSGTHGNMGGGQIEDGLSLWPLQWVITEAQKQGLVLEWTQPKGMKMADPTEFIYPKDAGPPKTFVLQNGIMVDMSDMRKVMDVKGKQPIVDVRKLKISLQTDRPIFRYGELLGRRPNDPNGTFVHPSVFLLDQTDTRTILAIDSFDFAENVRAQQPFSLPDRSRVFWNLHKRIATTKEAFKPRILVCGPDESIKLSLVNAAFGHDMTSDMRENDMKRGLIQDDKDFIVHLAPSFESAQPAVYETVHDFVLERRQQPIFQQQIHCIWYCTSSNYTKISDSDTRFKGIEFGGVPVIHVSLTDDPFSWGVKEMSLSDKSSATPEQTSTKWDQEMGIFSSNVLVSGTDVTALITASQKTLVNPQILRIHNQAQAVFVNEKLKLSVRQVVPLYLKERPEVYNIAKNVRLDRVLTASISTIAETFQHQGYFDPQEHVTSMRNLLYPPAPETSFADTLVSWLAPGLARSAGGALASGIFGPIGAVMFASSTVMGGILGAVNDTHKIHVLMLIACIDVLLVIERLFFYTKGAKIDKDELSLQVACVDYLHLKPQVTKKLSEVWKADGFTEKDWPDEEMLTNILEEVVASFRVKRITE